MPFGVQVTNATSTWDVFTGTLTISNPTDDVDIIIIGILKENALKFVAAQANSTVKINNTSYRHNFQYSTDNTNWITYSS